MNKILTVSCCMLGLAIACMPAYANPTDKKITLSCNVAAGTGVITGDATVTLCAGSGSFPCTGATFNCPSTPISCDSSGVKAPISITVSCSAPFEVDGLTALINVKDYDSAGNLIGTGGSNPNSTLGGKGFSTTTGTGTGSVNDTVTLTVK
jgi:hypothetical protein